MGAVAEPPPEVTAAWDLAVAGWEEPKRHDDVIALVAKHSCFAWAAARYKERAGDPIADKQIERVRKAATATMMATATARPEPASIPYRNTMLILLVLVILIGVGLVYALVRDRGSETAAATDVQH
jgi:hypothetical protein